MRPPEELETLRLFLRLPVLDDAARIFESYSQDPNVTEYLTWQPHQSISEARDYIFRSIACWENGTAFPWIITQKDNGQPIGAIEIRIDKYKADIGYVLAKAEWGRGYMPEAAERVVEWAMDQEEIYRVWAVCDIENKASARVLEKIGMKKEGVLMRWIKHPNISEEPRDCYSYAKVK